MRIKAMVLIAASVTSVASSSFIIPNHVIADPSIQTLKLVQIKPVEPAPIVNYFLQYQQTVPKKIEVEKAKIEPKIEEPKFKILTERELKATDLRQPSGLNVEQAEIILKGTNFEGLGKAFVQAEKDYHVNALYLISHAALESEWGKSRLSKVKNNIFGFAAYDENPGKYASSFDTKDECILYVTKYISEHYLTEGADCHEGYNVRAIGVNYASDKKWADKITEVMACLQGKVQDAQAI